ncbi:MAG TPA: hypothetical protein PKA13_23385 [Geminicoccaceae bacterium]|nr:hypothetical protein [Geminicoccus sp.]HMU52740.1 hypothetical protein [Geminicoccaceae bacterium]
MKTNCESTSLQVGEQDLNAFVDGVLDDGRRVDLFAHLASHPADAEKVNGYFRQQAMLAELRDLLSADDDDQFLPALQRRIDGAMTRQRLFVACRRLAAAVAVMAPVAAAAWWAVQPPAEESVIADAVLATTPVAGPAFPFGGNFAPIEGEAMEEGVASLRRLASYLDSQALRVPDLASLGLQLIGGETIEGVDLPAARLVYLDPRGNRLQVYIAVVEGDGQQALTMVPEGHLALNWRIGPLVFAVVGPASAPKLMEVMRSVTTDMTEMASAPANDVVPAAGGTVHGSAEVQPVVLPDGAGASDTAPAVLPAERLREPELTPVTLEEAQPKV